MSDELSFPGTFDEPTDTSVPLGNLSEVEPSSKAFLSPEEESSLKTWLVQRIDEIDTVLMPYRTKWNTFIQAYKAIRKTEVKTFPWEGCSNIYVPELADRVQSMTSYFLSLTMSTDQTFKTHAYKAKYRETAKAADKWLEFYTKIVQEQPDYWRRYLPYYILLGTHIMRPRVLEHGVPWPVVKLVPINLNYFYIYPSAKNVHETSIVGDFGWYPFSMLTTLAAEGMIDIGALERIRSYVYDQNARMDVFPEARTSDTRIDPWSAGLFTLYLSWYSPYTKEFKDINAIFHKESTELLLLNPCSPDKRPYEVARYREDEDDFFGIGLGDTTITLQDGINTVVNQAIDNGTVKNTSVFKMTRTAGVDEEVKIFPGKVISLAGMGDFDAVEMGRDHPQIFAIINTMRMLIQDASQVGENFAGQDSSVVKSRQTFGGQALNVQAGARNLTTPTLGYLTFLENLAWMTIETLSTYANDFDWAPVVQQYEANNHTPSLLSLDALPAPKVPRPETAVIPGAGSPELDEAAASVDDTDQELLKDESKVMRGSLDAALEARLTSEEADELKNNLFIRTVAENKQFFRIRAVRREDNKQVARQSALVLSQIVKQYTDQIIQLSMQVVQLQRTQGTEMIVSTILEAWKAANFMMQQVLATYSIEDADKLIILIEEVTNAVASQGNGVPGNNLGLPSGQASTPGENNLGPGQSGSYQQIQGGPAGITGGLQIPTETSSPTAK